MNENNLGTMGLQGVAMGHLCLIRTPLPPPPPRIVRKILTSPTRGHLGRDLRSGGCRNLELMGMFGANVWEGKY